MNLEGQKFGRLTALHLDGTIRLKRWVCQCSCGNIHSVLQAELRRGRSVSCGCISKENIEKIRIVKHGNAHRGKITSEYSTWLNMKSRCYNTKNKNFHSYGGRGIIMCDRWKDSFENFLADMGNKPTIKHTVERIDNDGNYEPTNCKWADHHEQKMNRRNTVIVYLDDKRITLLEVWIILQFCFI